MFVTKDQSASVDRSLEVLDPMYSSLQRRKSDLLLQQGDEESGVGTCPICLCDYENGDQICWSYNQDCLHHFHSDCGIAWLAKHSQCPICRAEYLVEPIKTREKDEDQIYENDLSSIAHEVQHHAMRQNGTNGNDADENV